MMHLYTQLNEYLIEQWNFPRNIYKLEPIIIGNRLGVNNRHLLASVFNCGYALGIKGSSYR